MIRSVSRPVGTDNLPAIVHEPSWHLLYILANFSWEMSLEDREKSTPPYRWPHQLPERTLVQIKRSVEVPVAIIQVADIAQRKLTEQWRKGV